MTSGWFKPGDRPRERLRLEKQKMHKDKWCGVEGAKRRRKMADDAHGSPLVIEAVTLLIPNRAYMGRLRSTNADEVALVPVSVPRVRWLEGDTE